MHSTAHQSTAELTIMAKQKIILKVAQTPVKMTIDSEKEEVYRLASKAVNEYISALEQKFGDNYSAQERLSIAALKFCIGYVEISRQNELSSDDLAALDALSQRMDKHLNRIKPHKSEASVSKK